MDEFSDFVSNLTHFAAQTSTALSQSPIPPSSLATHVPVCHMTLYQQIIYVLTYNDVDWAKHLIATQHDKINYHHAIRLAIEYNRPVIVQLLLAARDKPYLNDGNLFMKAIDVDNEEILKLLVQSKNINPPSPVISQYALVQNKLNLVKVFIDAGIVLSENLLIDAIDNDRYDDVRRFLIYRNLCPDIFGTNYFEHTVSKGKYESMKLIIEVKAYPDKCPDAIIMSNAQNDTNMLQLILDIYGPTLDKPIVQEGIVLAIIIGNIPSFHLLAPLADLRDTKLLRLAYLYDITTEITKTLIAGGADETQICNHSRYDKLVQFKRNILVQTLHQKNHKSPMHNALIVHEMSEKNILRLINAFV